MRSRSLFTPFIAGVLVSAMAIPRAEAHSEDTHTVATMVAFEYLKYRGATSPVDFAAVNTLNLVQFAITTQADPVDRMILGIDPDAALFDPPLTPLVIPKRNEPGLAGPIEMSPASALPSGFDGALFGSLVAAVDRRTDVWASATHPFQMIEEGIDETWGPLGKDAED